MSETFHIEKATERDVELILTFIRELAEYEILTDHVTATEEQVRRSLFGSPKFAQSIVGYDHNVPVAFAVYFFNYSTFSARLGLYLEDIYVRPSYRRSGVGRQIFSFLAREAITCGCARLELSVLNWNQPAINFYKHLGGQPLDGWTIFRFSEDRLHQLAKPIEAADTSES
jgi:GNAT superfamily N-acetyltransferase